MPKPLTVGLPVVVAIAVLAYLVAGKGESIESFRAECAAGLADGTSLKEVARFLSDRGCGRTESTYEQILQDLTSRAQYAEENPQDALVHEDLIQTYPDAAFSCWSSKRLGLDGIMADRRAVIQIAFSKDRKLLGYTVEEVVVGP